MNKSKPRELTLQEAAEEYSKAREKEETEKAALAKQYATLTDEEKFRQYYEYAKREATYRRSEEKKQKGVHSILTSTLASVGAVTAGVTFGKWCRDGFFDGRLWHVIVRGAIGLGLSLLQALAIVFVVTIGLYVHGDVLRGGRSGEDEQKPSKVRMVVAVLVTFALGFILRQWVI